MAGGSIGQASSICGLTSIAGAYDAPRRHPESSRRAAPQPAIQAPSSHSLPSPRPQPRAATAAAAARPTRPPTQVHGAVGAHDGARAAAAARLGLQVQRPDHGDGQAEEGAAPLGGRVKRLHLCVQAGQGWAGTSVGARWLGTRHARPSAPQPAVHSTALAHTSAVRALGQPCTMPTGHTPAPPTGAVRALGQASRAQRQLKAQAVNAPQQRKLTHRCSAGPLAGQWGPAPARSRARCGAAAAPRAP